MRKISFAPLTLALFAVLLFYSGGSPRLFAHEQPGVIRFGVYPYETARSVYSLYAPLGACRSSPSRNEAATNK
ncbi:MAG: hypothetical protein ACYC9M_10400 [Desulfobulbaceae bacterium]